MITEATVMISGLKLTVSDQTKIRSSDMDHKGILMSDSYKPLDHSGWSLYLEPLDDGENMLIQRRDEPFPAGSGKQDYPFANFIFVEPKDKTKEAFSSDEDRDAIVGFEKAIRTLCSESNYLFAAVVTEPNTKCFLVYSVKLERMYELLQKQIKALNQFQFNSISESDPYWVFYNEFERIPLFLSVGTSSTT